MNDNSTSGTTATACSLSDRLEDLILQSRSTRQPIQFLDFPYIENKDDAIHIDLLALIEKMNELHTKNYKEWLKTISALSQIYNRGNQGTYESAECIFNDKWSTLKTQNSLIEYLDLLLNYEAASQSTSLSVTDEEEMEQRSKDLEKIIVDHMNNKRWIERVVVYHLMERQRIRDALEYGASALHHNIGIHQCLDESADIAPIGAQMLLEHAIASETFRLSSYIDDYTALQEASRIPSRELPDIRIDSLHFSRDL